MSGPSFLCPSERRKTPGRIQADADPSPWFQSQCLLGFRPRLPRRQLERCAGRLNVRVNGQFMLRAAPGVVESQANVVTCSYTDPAGLFVEITRVLTGR
jgi:hypothetical protein